MQGSLDCPPITLQTARKRGLQFLLLGLPLLFVGALLFAAASKASFAAIFFFATGLYLVSKGLLAITTPLQLIIDPDGIRLKGALRTRSYSWDQVDNFRLVQVRRAQLIGFDKPGGISWLRDLGLAFVAANISSSYDAVLPGVWSSLSAEAVVDLLNDARARWRRVSATQAVATRRRGSSGQRIDRRLYWLAVVVLLSLSMLFSYVTHGARGLAGSFTLFWIWIYARRLHDIGRSGWWQAPMFGAVVVIVAVLMAKLHWNAQVATGGAFLIQLAFTAVLGAIPSDPVENRFGPPPGAEPMAEVFG